MNIEYTVWSVVYTM